MTPRSTPALGRCLHRTAFLHPASLGGRILCDTALAPLPSRSASRRSTAASALSSNNPPYLVSVNATLLCPAHSETSRTLQPAATMIATKLCRSPWKLYRPTRHAAPAARQRVPRSGIVGHPQVR